MTTGTDRTSGSRTSLHPQLAAIATEFGAALERLRALGTLPAERWTARPAPGRWSVAECIAHLNLTSRAFLPLLEEGLARAARLGEPPPRRYRRDLAGWLLWRTLPPPARIRFKTTAPFLPESLQPAAQLIADFVALQAAQVALLRSADGLPLDRIRVTSPFSSRVRYNLYSCFSILPRHQQRHLWQAEQAAAEVPAPLWRFRSATGADSAAVRELVFSILAEFGFTPDPAGTDADLDDLERSYLARGGAFELVLDRHDRLVGCAGLYPTGAKTVELRKMYLRPEARGQGLGRRLLAHVMEVARELEFDVMELQTASVLDRAIAMYRQAGFQPYEPAERVPRCDIALRLALAGAAAAPAPAPVEDHG